MPEAVNTTTSTDAAEAPKALPIAPRWKQKIEAARRKRETIIETMKTNVAFRLNKTLTETPEQDTITVPVDWARTKAKQSQLFFQVPEIKLRARAPQYAPAVSVAAAAINYELEHEIKAHVMMDECLADVINAAGHMVCLIGYEATFEKVKVPAIDASMYLPEQLSAHPAVVANGGKVPMTDQDRLVYQCYYAHRISPAHFLKPADFIGSDFQKAEWVAHDGILPLAEAIRRGWVDASFEGEHEDKLVTTNEATEDAEHKSVGKYVKYTQLFHRKAATDPNEKDPRKIGHVVMVDGKDKPVVDEDLKWQEYNPETRTWIGLKDFPIKVATLTTVSDEAFPPSDSEMGRSQVRELIRSRSQMIRQRDRNQPLRWYDVNMVDDEVAAQLDKGIIQDMIPMEGPGDRAIGEVARANFPRENFDFQNIITHDLDEAWAMSPNQMGFATQGDTSARETQVMQDASSVRLEYERARVLRFFLEVAEGIFSLMQLFQDDQKWVEMTDPQSGQAMLQAWDRTKIRGDYIFEAKPDAAVRVDIGQKRVEALNVYKLLRRDPLINPQELVKTVLDLHGLDATRMFVPPQPPAVEKPDVKYSFGGADLANPMAVALMQKTDNPLTPDDIKAAKLLMQDAGVPEVPASVMPLPEPGDPGQPEALGPEGVEAMAAGAALPPALGRPPEHPGVTPDVEPLNVRYERNSAENQVQQ